MQIICKSCCYCQGTFFSVIDVRHVQGETAHSSIHSYFWLMEVRSHSVHSYMGSDGTQIT